MFRVEKGGKEGVKKKKCSNTVDDLGCKNSGYVFWAEKGGEKAKTKPRKRRRTATRSKWGKDLATSWAGETYWPVGKVLKPRTRVREIGYQRGAKKKKKNSN